MYTIFDPVMLKVQGSYQEFIPLAAKYGIGGLGITKAFLDDEAQAVEITKVLNDYGLEWGMLPFAEDFYAADVTDERFEEGLERLKRWASVCEKIGLKRSFNHIWSGSDTRDFDENFEWHVRRMGRVYRVLQNHGMSYGLEFLGPKHIRDGYRYPFVYTLAGVLALADAVNKDIGFLFDTYHWYCGGGRMDDLYLAAQNTERMICVHLNDAIAGVSREEQQDFMRELPMTTGVIPADAIMKLFYKKGYAGPVVCEPLGPPTDRFHGMIPEDAIKEVAQACKRSLNFHG